VTNRFSNEEGESNGLIKAWAQINLDGTIAACWCCGKDMAVARRTAPRGLRGRLTPLATDIRGRPRSATIDGLRSPRAASSPSRIAVSMTARSSSAHVTWMALSLLDLLS